MGWSRLPRNAEVDPENPRAWATCDRCGFQWNLFKLAWQYQYEGTAIPQNTMLLVCPKCMDSLQPQLTPQILPPDPPPVFNARPENYALDEDNNLSTQPIDDMLLQSDNITTQSDEPIVTDIPNPADSPSEPVNPADP